jgi:nucleoside-diphosphate-sugar epimerase
MLLVTGYPGWLTDGFFSYIEKLDANPWTKIRCIVHPDARLDPAVEALIPKNIQLIRVDLADREGISSAMEGVTHVLHAAGILHVKRTKEWYTVNTDYTKQLIDIAVAANVKRFVFISSNAAAGRSEKRGSLLTETQPAKPLSHYGRSKYLAEQYVNTLSDKIETVILRPCMFYGPPVPARHVDIYKRIRTGKMPLVGDGGYDRSRN